MMCPLCTALEREKQFILYDDEDMFILPTKNLKEHKKRIMVVSKKHISYENIQPEKEKEMLRKFVIFCKDYFDEEPTFALVEPKYCTIPEHWHLIACDWKGQSDIQQLHYTPHKSIETKVNWKPKDVK